MTKARTEIKTPVTFEAIVVYFRSPSPSRKAEPNSRLESGLEAKRNGVAKERNMLDHPQLYREETLHAHCDWGKLSYVSTSSKSTLETCSTN